MAINHQLLDKYLTKPIDDEHDFIISLQGLLRNFQLKRTVDNQNQIIRDLYEFSNRLNTMNDFEETLGYIASFIHENLQCPQIAIMLIEGKVLSLKGGAGIDKSPTGSLAFPLDEQGSDEIVQMRRASIVRAYEDIPGLARKLPPEQRSFLNFPLLCVGLSSGEQPLGMICSGSKAGDAKFREADLEYLTYIAQTASIAIHNQVNRTDLQKTYLKTKMQAAVLEYQATHDSLTDLPNRTLLQDRLQQAILVAKRVNKPFALLIMDLDRFKEINDTLGHHNGDAVLRQIGQRLRETLRESDTMARMGGDEFAALLPETDFDGALQAARNLLAALKAQFVVEGLTIEVGMSIGIAFFPDHGEDLKTLIQHADVAMYLAKESGGGYATYDSKHDRYNPDRLILISELRSGVEHNQLVLNYQPIVDLKSKKIMGAEALVRWQHPKRGLLYPDKFIPLAEQTGQIGPLTLWVLNEAIRQSWIRHKAGLTFGVSVNLSVRSIQDRQFMEQFMGLMANSIVSPGLFKLEITETAIMTDATWAMEILTRLSQGQVRIAIDDFGTGYSSLAYLKKLPVHEVKIDKSFVSGMTTDEDDAAIVQSIINLAHNLGLQVVAEGVEDRETWDRLVALGCDAAQGFYISRPILSDDLAVWFDQWTQGLKKP
jgi:diguanylate cyclase (GGDEF)-like protein